MPSQWARLSAVVVVPSIPLFELPDVTHTSIPQVDSKFRIKLSDRFSPLPSSLPPRRSSSLHSFAAGLSQMNAFCKSTMPQPMAGRGHSPILVIRSLCGCCCCRCYSYRRCIDIRWGGTCKTRNFAGATAMHSFCPLTSNRWHNCPHFFCFFFCFAFASPITSFLPSPQSPACKKECEIQERRYSPTGLLVSVRHVAVSCRLACTNGTTQRAAGYHINWGVFSIRGKRGLLSRSLPP